MWVRLRKNFMHNDPIEPCEKNKRLFPPRTDVSFMLRYIYVIGDCFLHSGSWLLTGFGFRALLGALLLGI